MPLKVYNGDNSKVKKEAYISAYSKDPEGSLIHVFTVTTIYFLKSKKPRNNSYANTMICLENYHLSETKKVAYMFH